MASTQTTVLSEVAAACQQASDLFSRADMIVRKIKALGMATTDVDGNITGINITSESFEGTLEGLDGRDVLGFLMTFGAISGVIQNPIDQSNGRLLGDALLGSPRRRGEEIEMLDFINLSETRFAGMDEAEFVTLPEDRRPAVPTKAAKSTCPIALLTGGGELRGASFGNLWEVDDVLFGTTNTPRLRYPAILKLLSPYRDSEIRYTLNGRSPTASSALYVEPLTFGPVEVEERRIVMARAFDKANVNRKSRVVRLEFRVLPPR